MIDLKVGDIFTDRYKEVSVITKLPDNPNYPMYTLFSSDGDSWIEVAEVVEANVNDGSWRIIGHSDLVQQLSEELHSYEQPQSN